MKTDSEIEIIPGNSGQPLFTPEEDQEFREYWQQTVTPLLGAQPKPVRLFPD